MATALDDYAIHQIVENMELVEGRNPRWTDEVWFHAGSADGKINISAYIGVYPQTATMDAAVSVVIGGKQYNVRASRIVNGDRDTKQVDCISAEIIEPFQEWQFIVEEKENQPISLKISFKSLNQPIEVSAPVQHRNDGRQLVWDQWRYVQTGNFQGQIQHEGETIDFSGSGAKERAWGIRPILGQIPNLGRIPESIGKQSIWFSAEIDNESFWFWKIEPSDQEHANHIGNLSDTTGRTKLDGGISGPHGKQSPSQIVAIDSKLNYAKNGVLIDDSQVTITDWNDSIYEIEIHPLATLYAKGLGYGHETFRHIEYKGVQYENEEYDLTSNTQTDSLIENSTGHLNPFIAEQFCELKIGKTTGYGIVRVSN